MTGGEAFVIWLDRIKAGAFEDTNRMFTPSDCRTPEYWAEEAMKLLRPVFDPKRPTALLLGRYQPFHDGHRALITEGLKRVGQACIAVRNTQGVDNKNPFDFEYVRSRIEQACASSRAASSLFPSRTSRTSTAVMSFRRDRRVGVSASRPIATAISTTRRSVVVPSRTACLVSISGHPLLGRLQEPISQRPLPGLASKQSSAWCSIDVRPR
jgi:hypothetical protein